MEQGAGILLGPGAGRPLTTAARVPRRRVKGRGAIRMCVRKSKDCHAHRLHGALPFCYLFRKNVAQGKANTHFFGTRRNWIEVGACRFRRHAQTQNQFRRGAGYENRTRHSSLGRTHLATRLIPRTASSGYREKPRKST